MNDSKKRTIKNSNINNHTAKNDTYLAIPCWISMINEMHDALGFSWARIAARIGSSPSSVQKLVKDFRRVPRDKMFFNLACYYHKIFYSEASLPKARKFIQENSDQTLCDVVIELISRGFLNDFELTKNHQEIKKKFISFAQSKGYMAKEEVGVSNTPHGDTLPTYHVYFQ